MLVADDGGSQAADAMCCFISIESKGKKSKVSYTHMNELSTIMWILNISGSIGKANANNAMTDLF